jgi:hypothetical protein
VTHHIRPLLCPDIGSAQLLNVSASHQACDLRTKIAPRKVAPAGCIRCESPSRESLTSRIERDKIGGGLFRLRAVVEIDRVGRIHLNVLDAA